MSGKVFFDTNVLIYAVAQGDPRSRRAEELLAAGGIISVQVLNEFVSVARRKVHMSWSETHEALDAILDLCPDPVPISLALHQRALRVAEDYGFGIYDALIVAGALQERCKVLYSEDLQDGQVVGGKDGKEKKLTIRNPFQAR